MLDERFKVLVFNYHVCHPVLKLLNESEQPADIERLTSEGFAPRRIAVAEQFKEHGGSTHVVILGDARSHFHQLCRFGRWKRQLGELQFLRQIPIVKGFMLEKPFPCVEILARV